MILVLSFAQASGTDLHRPLTPPTRTDPDLPLLIFENSSRYDTTTPTVVGHIQLDRLTLKSSKGLGVSRVPCDTHGRIGVVLVVFIPSVPFILSI
jgi:hypothetical protein